MKIAEIDLEALDEWIATRPPVAQEMIRSHPPDRLYRIGADGNRCTIHSYAEDRTCTVIVNGKYNFVIFDRNVFGVPVDDLIECDGPAEGEVVGALTNDDKHIDAIVAAKRKQMARTSRKTPQGESNEPQPK